MASCLKHWQRNRPGGPFRMGVALIMSLLLAPCLDSNGSGGHGAELPQVGVVAHRGAGAGETFPDRPPENTLPALLWGWAQGSPWVECDVILSGDGVPVVTHDFSSKRISDKSINLDTSSLEANSETGCGFLERPAMVWIANTDAFRSSGGCA